MNFSWWNEFLMNFSQLPLSFSLDKVFIYSNLGRVRLELEGWSSSSQLRTVTVPGTREQHRRSSCSPLTNPVSHTAWPCSNIFHKNGSPIIHCTVLHLHILTYFTLSGFTLWPHIRFWLYVTGTRATLEFTIDIRHPQAQGRALLPPSRPTSTSGFLAEGWPWCLIQAKGSREKNLRRSQEYDASFLSTLPSTSSAL